MEWDHWDLLSVAAAELVETLRATALLTDPAPLRDLAGWLASVLEARGVSPDVVTEGLHHLRVAVRRRVPAALPMVDEAIDGTAF
jgi:hypothetical protein